LNYDETAAPQRASFAFRVAEGGFCKWYASRKVIAFYAMLTVGVRLLPFIVETPLVRG
jgi:secreted protein with Ig-like and vWFA domain